MKDFYINAHLNVQIFIIFAYTYVHYIKFIHLNMEELLEQSDLVIERVSTNFKRYLYQNINWQARLIGIKGARGTGKTTLLLQWLHEKGLPGHKAAYFTLDDFYFTTNSLVDTAKKFHKQGGEVLVLDEVHKYPNWSMEIKNLYDRYPDLQIVFTGSSIIDIAKQEGDLSRRALMYELHGLSYREFLQFTGVLDLPPVQLDEIIQDPSIHKNFPQKFKPLEHFRHYLDYGYYPFFMESTEDYKQRIKQLVRTIVEYDMAELKGFDIRNAKKMLQLLYIIAQNVPFKPNLKKLAEKSNIHRNSIANYLHFLEQARLLWLLYPGGISIATLQKPEKIFLNNTNFLHALTMKKPSAGTTREVFFNNQLQVNHKLNIPQKGDFIVDDQYIFEIGGKSKTTHQIANIPDSYVVKDDLEYPAGKALPLWLFGFLY